MDAVRRYDVLDTPPDGSFDRLTALAARACNTPVAIVSIVDSDRIWFKSHHGLDVDEVGREPGLCASAVLQDGPWVVEDAEVDPRTLVNPLVAGEMGLRFYLGVPLTTNDGHNLGTLCALDFEPRPATDREIADMTDLAAVVVDELELRLATRRLLVAEEEQLRQAEERSRVLQESLSPRSLPQLDDIDLAARYVPAHRERVGGDFYDAIATDTGVALVIGDVTGHGPDAAALTAMARHTTLAFATGDWSPAQSLTSLSRAIRLRQPDHDFPRFCTVGAVRLEREGPTWQATACLAGHPYPWLVKPDGTFAELGVAGPILGWIENPAYTDVVFEVEPGDIVVLYTDGLTDASPGQPTLDSELFRRAIAGVADESAATIADALLAAVATRTWVPRDDIAVLVARFGARLDVGPG